MVEIMGKRGRMRKEKRENENTSNKPSDISEHGVGQRKNNLWMYSTFILLAALVITGIAAISSQKSEVTGACIAEESIVKIPTSDAARKAIDYINNNILSGQEAKLVSVSDIGNGIYRMALEIGGRKFESYLSSDGRLLFPSGINLSKAIEKPEVKTRRQQGFDAPDREKPNVKFFVMSFCPFGNQAEFGLEPVYRLLKEKVEWEPHYVIYSNYMGGSKNYCLDNESKYCSMHGIQELNQDVRELCVWKYYSEPDHSKWWDFVIKVNKNCNARNADTCWEQYAKEVGIDVEKIKKCQKEEALDLLKREVELNQQYGVRGSPTVFINDQRYSGLRTPQAYLNAICSGFASPPEECSEQISSQSGSASRGGCEA
ncbi:MAG TPA: hypothetical protein ENG42_00535 [Candidatus Aenigmarchaeota archaeon]|nr:hypothetical protein [Candidatus Aenigmarchaeota archaeon]